MSVERIKQFCAILQTHNITRIEANYDGSGDSGDLSVHFIAQTSRRQRGQNPIPMTERYNEQDMERILTSEPKPLTTAQEFHTFLDNLWDLLPGGWEIDDGSFGEINVDVVERTIEVEHNERYTDVRSESYSY